MAKPKDAPLIQWEAAAPDLTVYGRPVHLLDRDWLPGVWQDLTDAEKALIDRNYGVLIFREKAIG